MWKFRTLTLAFSRYAGEGTKLGGGKQLWLQGIYHVHAHEHVLLILIQPIKLCRIMVKNLVDHLWVDVAAFFQLGQSQ